MQTHAPLNYYVSGRLAGIESHLVNIIYCNAYYCIGISYCNFSVTVPV